MNLDLYSGTVVVGIVQAVFLAISLLIKKGNIKLANCYLAVLMMGFCMSLGVHFMTITQIWESHQFIYISLSTAVFAIGPSLYLYVKQMTTPKLRFNFGLLLHYLPVLLNMLYFFLIMQRNTIEISNTAPNKAALVSWLLPIAKIASLALYSVLSLRLLMRHADKVRHLFADLGSVNLNWLRNLIFGFILMAFIFVMFSFFGIDISQIPGEIDTILSLIIILLIFMTGFYGMHQPQIFSEELSVIAIQEVDATPVKEARLPEDIASEINAKLLNATQQFELFQDHFLDLQKLAKAVDVTPHQLSYFLNQHLKTNFYEFVNKQRVTRAREALEKTSDRILDIALDSGFSNKATFNAAFKRETQMTPSQYRSKFKVD